MTKIAYKLFRIKKGEPEKLFPLFVLRNREVPFGIWLKAEEGERLPNNKVHSSLGPLSFRPGWHLSDIPLAIHIGIKEAGEIRYMHDNHLWCQCEYKDDICYQPEANLNGTYNGAFHPRDAYLRHVPENGYYRYKTSPNMLGDWIIAGDIKVLRVLRDEEVARICKEAGYEPMPRKERCR